MHESYEYTILTSEKKNFTQGWYVEKPWCKRVRQLRFRLHTILTHSLSVNDFVLLKGMPAGCCYIQRREIKIFLSQNKYTVSVLSPYMLKRNSPQTMRMSFFICSVVNNVCQIYRLKRNMISILAYSVCQATTNAKYRMAKKKCLLFHNWEAFIVSGI